MSKATKNDVARRKKDAEDALIELKAINWKENNFNLFSYWNTYFMYKRIIEECNDLVDKEEMETDVTISTTNSLTAE